MDPAGFIPVLDGWAGPAGAAGGWLVGSGVSSGAGCAGAGCTGASVG